MTTATHGSGERGVDAAPARASAGALAGLALAALLAALGTSSANVALPTLAQSFAAPFAQVQWVVLTYLLAITTLVVGVGRLADRVGRRRLLLAGLALFALASGACALAPTLPALLLARALQGAAAAILMALSLALVGETVPRARNGSAMGLLGTMSAVGTALGPSLGGILIAGFGWRAIFLVKLPLALLAFVLLARSLPPDRRGTDDGGLDAAGTLLLALTLAAYALALTSTSQAALLGTLAALGLVLLVRVEARAKAPLLALSIFRQAVFVAGFATSALVAAVLMATLVVGPFYLAHALGLDASRVGLVMAAGPAVAALTGVPAGRAVDRFGEQPMLLAGLAGVGGGALLFALLPERLGLAGYLGPLVLMTGAYALFQTANNTSVMGAVDGERRGVVAGLLSLSRNLGLISGAALIGALFAFAVVGAGGGEVAAAPPQRVAAGMRYAFAVAAALIGVALAIALASRVPRLPPAR